MSKEHRKRRDTNYFYLAATLCPKRSYFLGVEIIS